MPIGDITVIAGQSTGGIDGHGAGYAGDGGPATAAELDLPQGLALDAAGDIFVADSYNDVIREVVESQPVATSLHVNVGDIITVAGDGTRGYSGDGGAATKAELNFPNGVALDAHGDIFIGDTDNNVVREVIESSGDITTVAGDGTFGYEGDGGAATDAELEEPQGVALDSAGDLFIADAGSERVREVVESNAAATALGVAKGDIVTVAGNGTPYSGGSGGSATGFGIDTPRAVTLDAASDLFIVADDVIFEVPATTSATSVTVTALTGLAVYGQPVTFTATVTGPAGVTPTGMVTFTDNGTILGSAPPNAAGVATLATSSLVIGSNSVTASYGGAAGLASSASAQPAVVSVAQARTLIDGEVVVVYHRRKVVKLTQKTQVKPVAPGAGVPTGTVAIELIRKNKRPKTLGMLTLVNGAVPNLTISPKDITNNSITIEFIYSGDTDFEGDMTTKGATFH